MTPKRPSLSDRARPTMPPALLDRTTAPQSSNDQDCQRPENGEPHALPMTRGEHAFRRGRNHRRTVKRHRLVRNDTEKQDRSHRQCPPPRLTCEKNGGACKRHEDDGSRGARSMWIGDIRETAARTASGGVGRRRPFLGVHPDRICVAMRACRHFWSGLTTGLSGRPRCRCRSQMRPTMPHGLLQRIVSHHAVHEV